MSIQHLCRSCTSGNVHSVKYILSHPRTKPNEFLLETNEHGFSALQCACFNGYKEIVELLRNHVPDDQVVMKNYTNAEFNVLFLSIFKGHVGIVELLSRHSPNEQVVMKSEKGFSALLYGLALVSAISSCCMIHDVTILRYDLVLIRLYICISAAFPIIVFFRPYQFVFAMVSDIVLLIPVIIRVLEFLRKHMKEITSCIFIRD